jgi:hypothetical protein
MPLTGQPQLAPPEKRIRIQPEDNHFLTVVVSSMDASRKSQPATERVTHQLMEGAIRTLLERS